MKLGWIFFHIQSWTLRYSDPAVSSAAGSCRPKCLLLVALRSRGRRMFIRHRVGEGDSSAQRQEEGPERADLREKQNNKWVISTGWKEWLSPWLHTVVIWGALKSTDLKPHPPTSWCDWSAPCLGIGIFKALPRWVQCASQLFFIWPSGITDINCASDLASSSQTSLWMRIILAGCDSTDSQPGSAKENYLSVGPPKSALKKIPP